MEVSNVKQTHEFGEEGEELHDKVNNYGQRRPLCDKMTDGDIVESAIYMINCIC